MKTSKIKIFDSFKNQKILDSHRKLDFRDAQKSKISGIKKFTFIIPNTTWFGRRYWHNFPYTEALLSAVLKQKGYSVKIIDANINNLSEEDLEKEIREKNPKIIGIGEMSLEYKDCVHKSFEIAKKTNPEIITISGGIYPTLSPEIVTKDKNVDFVVFGEGEERLPELL